MSEWLDCVGCGEIFSDQPPALYCPDCFTMMEAEAHQEEVAKASEDLNKLLEKFKMDFTITPQTYTSSGTAGPLWDKDAPYKIDTMKFQMSNGVLGHTVSGSNT